MSSFFDSIRRADKKISVKRQISHTVCIMMMGIALGVIAKYLDCTPSNNLPFMFQYLDITNFLGRFAIWIFLALCISVYSVSPARAGINVFLFFAGMVASYYLYSKFIAGFFPRSYAAIWVGFTVISPFLAVVCWYAKGKSMVSLILSAEIIAVLFNMTFVYGWIYFDVRSLPELATFFCGLAVMKRGTIRDTVVMTVMGVLWRLRLILLLCRLNLVNRIQNMISINYSFLAE